MTILDFHLMQKSLSMSSKSQHSPPPFVAHKHTDESRSMKQLPDDIKTLGVSFNVPFRGLKISQIYDQCFLFIPAKKKRKLWMYRPLWVADHVLYSFLFLFWWKYVRVVVLHVHAYTYKYIYVYNRLIMINQ